MIHRVWGGGSAMWQAIKATYRNAWTFAIALPLLAALAIGFEALQHVVEWSIGMYASRHAALLTQFHPARTVAGIAKVLVVFALGFWVARFVISGGATSFTLRRDTAALRRYAVVVAFGIVIGIAPEVAAAVLPRVGLPRAGVLGITAVVFIGGTLLRIALSYWFAVAAVAERQATAAASLRIAGPSVVWGLGLTLAVILPPMVLHYIFGLGAIGKPAPVAVAMLSLDAILVGFLSLLIGAITVTIARRMADRAGLPLAA